MQNIEYPVTIPDCYFSMSGNNKKLFVGYVKGYIKRNHPRFKPLRIEGRHVICVRREADEER